jgi:hypothetical protein
MELAESECLRPAPDLDKSTAIRSSRNRNASMKAEKLFSAYQLSAPCFSFVDV